MHLVTTAMAPGEGTVRRTTPVALVAAIGLVVGALVFVSGGVPRAAAGYGALADGTAVVTAELVPEPVAPVAVVNGSSVTVSWTGTTSSGGRPADGYVVERLDAGGTPVAIGSGCSGTIAATACTELGVAVGTWRYRVRAVVGGWTGPASAPGAPVSVAGAVLTLTSTLPPGSLPPGSLPPGSLPLTSLPATVTGTLDGFGVGEALTFHLDAPTGPLLASTPAVVTTSTGQPVSVTVPAGTADSPRALVAVGSLGSVASVALPIVMPPVLTSLTMHDVDADGRVDEVRAVFDDVLAPYAAGVAPWTLTNVPSGGSLASVAVSGTTAVLTIAEGAGAPTTAVGSFTVALGANSAGVRDVNGHPASFTARAPADLAPPAPVTLTLRDANANGRVDQITITWSETLAATATGTAGWTLVDVPSAGTLSAATSSGTTGTLTITEGPGALDTGVGAMTVALAATTTGPRDAAGNRSAFAARPPADGARPVLVSFSDTNGTADGRAESGDALVAVFSEPLDRATVGTTTTVTFRDPNGGGNDSVSIAQLTNGFRSLGANGYVSTNNRSYSFAASPISWSNGDRTVTVTLGPTCSGTCTAVATQLTNATFSFQPATTIRDTSGNAILTTTRSSPIRLF